MEILRDQADAGVEFAINKLSQAPTEFNQFYWYAFGELTSERSVGMSIGAIPHSKIREFADEHGIYGYDRYVLHYCIRGLDNAQLKHIREVNEKRSKAGK